MATISYGYSQQIYGQPRYPAYGRAQPAQFVITNAQPQQKRYKGYTASHKFCAKGLGVMTVVIGILCMLFQIVASALYHEYEGLAWTDGYVWSGAWLGAWFILTGIIGIISTNNNEHGWIVAFMVLNIVSCSLVTWVMLGMASASLGIIEQCAQEYQETYYPYYPYYVTTQKPCSSPENAGLAMNSLILISSLILLVVTIAASIIGCNTTCCSDYQGQVYDNNLGAHYSGGVVQISTISRYPPSQEQTAGIPPGQNLPTYDELYRMAQPHSATSQANSYNSTDLQSTTRDEPTGRDLRQQRFH